MSDFQNCDFIKINGSDIRRPDNFSPSREDIYGGEYTSSTGARVMDYVGWRFADMTLTWEALPQSSVAILNRMTAPSTITFDAPGDDFGNPIERTERIVRTSTIQALHPYEQDGEIWYRGVSVDIRFLDAYTTGIFSN